MSTQNQKRENNAFESMPKQRVESSKDDFLDRNKYIVGVNIETPTGGACEGQDVARWFPVSKNGSFSKKDLLLQQSAIEICRKCPIRAKCLMYSLEYEPHGIWGGFPEATRCLLAKFWGIRNKRTWTVKPSFTKYRNILDYILNPVDINFVRTLANEQNFPSPPFDERNGISATAARRIRLGLAETTSGNNWNESRDGASRTLR